MQGQREPSIPGRLEPFAVARWTATMWCPFSPARYQARAQAVHHGSPPRHQTRLHRAGPATLVARAAAAGAAARLRRQQRRADAGTAPPADRRQTRGAVWWQLDALSVAAHMHAAHGGPITAATAPAPPASATRPRGTSSDRRADGRENKGGSRYGSHPYASKPQHGVPPNRGAGRRAMRCPFVFTVYGTSNGAQYEGGRGMALRRRRGRTGCSAVAFDLASPEVDRVRHPQAIHQHCGSCGALLSAPRLPTAGSAERFMDEPRTKRDHKWRSAAYAPPWWWPKSRWRLSCTCTLWTANTWCNCCRQHPGRRQRLQLS